MELARAREAVARLTAPESAAPVLLGSAVAAAAAGAAVDSGAVPGADGGLNGIAGGTGKSGRGSPAAVKNSATSVSMSSIDEVTLQEATQKVRLWYSSLVR